MYAISYIAGMVSMSVLAYALVYMNRRNKKEAMTLGVSTFAVIAILGIVKLLFL